jgi:hypothetical protein
MVYLLGQTGNHGFSILQSAEKRLPSVGEKKKKKKKEPDFLWSFSLVF